MFIKISQVPSFRLAVTAINPKATYTFHVGAILLFHILQNYYLNKSAYFRGAGKR
jgi:hypothetical protein